MTSMMLLTKQIDSCFCQLAWAGAGASPSAQSNRSSSGKGSLSLYTMRNCLLRSMRKETELQLERVWWKPNRQQAGCSGHGMLNSFLLATPAQAVAASAAGFCPVLHATLLIKQWHDGTVIFSGRKRRRLESKQSCLFSSRGDSSAEPSFSSLPDHMDTSAAETQGFRARRKPLERMTGWAVGRWLARADLPPNARPQPWSRQYSGNALSFDLTCKNTQGRNYANSPTGSLERIPYFILKNFEYTIKGAYTHTFGFPVSFSNKASSWLLRIFKEKV